MKKHDVAIIGAGLSGIVTTKTLLRLSPETKFVIISEDIGGRALSSEDRKVHFGAYFLLKNYKHVRRRE
ncbi:MAG: monoamine oxidase [Candidatus Saccharimonadales bacterium]|jgi:monoamine oxidase